MENHRPNTNRCGLLESSVSKCLRKSNLCRVSLTVTVNIVIDALGILVLINKFDNFEALLLVTISDVEFWTLIWDIKVTYAQLDDIEEQWHTKDKLPYMCSR